MKRMNQHGRHSEYEGRAAGWSAMNLVFFGMSGQFSRLPLEALIRDGLTPRAIVTPGLASGPIASPVKLGASAAPGRRELPSLTPLTLGGLGSVAAAHGIPFHEIRTLSSQRTLDSLAAMEPDLIVVACFPWRLPSALLRMPRLGCVNLHPSLLPLNRGPDPLFWTFRNGEAHIGVTVHQMTPIFDAGAILLQRAIPVEDGVTEAILERRCAEIGGPLLVEALRRLAMGSITPEPQDERRATTYPAPGQMDYMIDPAWSARRCENFTCGVMGRGRPITIQLGDGVYRIIEPLGYANEETLDAVYRRDGDVVTLRRAPGVWRARVAPL